MPAKLIQSCPALCNLLSMGFSRQEYWSGLPFPTPGDLPNPGSSPRFLGLLHWQVGSLPLVPPGKHSCYNTISLYLVYVEMLVSRYSLIKNLSGLYLRSLGGICKTMEFPSDKMVCPGGSNGKKKVCLQC